MRFPDNIGRGARDGPERRTQIVELASGDEERNASWANSRRRYDVAYGIRRADDLAAPHRLRLPFPDREEIREMPVQRVPHQMTPICRLSPARLRMTDSARLGWPPVGSPFGPRGRLDFFGTCTADLAIGAFGPCTCLHARSGYRPARRPVKNHVVRIGMHPDIEHPSFRVARQPVEITAIIANKHLHMSSKTPVMRMFKFHLPAAGARHAFRCLLLPDDRTT